MNIKLMPLESLSDMILVLLYALLLPLGIWILFNLDEVAKKWYELSKKKATSEYRYFLGFSMRSYTSVSWNKVVFMLIGSAAILIGSISTLYLVMTLADV